MGTPVKTYHPTLEQMKDFSAYMRHIHDTGGHRAGLCKIVPPSGYKPRKAGYEEEKLYEMDILSPIKQEVTGEKGLYQQLNVVDKKRITVRNFKRLSEEKHPTPYHNDPETDLDRLFWKNIFTNPSIYGADVPGTLYDDDCKEFNLTRLNTILDNIREDYGVTIQGVNTTYLYFGMWKSSFCWHTEDMDLYSINYLHTGAPKSWYCIAPEYGKRFERLAASFFPHSFRLCRAFLRHKTTLISPQILKKYSIPFSRATQYPGEFMVTFPFSYHSGYNHGFNIAEATNFALEYWIEFGKWATRCECSSESVKISMQTFVKRYQSDRYENWLQGRDVCKDPRDPKHVAAAPRPTEYDLYVIGNHDRQEDNESSSVPKKPKKNHEKIKRSRAFEATCRLYGEFLKVHDNTQMPPTEIVPMIAPIKKKIKLKKDKRSLERNIASKELLQFLPLTFTHEKKFNRCIAAQSPHCSVCQLFVPHPKDDENIWGPSREHTEEPVPQPTVAGPQVEAFKLPESSSVILPRSVFIRNPPQATDLTNSELKHEEVNEGVPEFLDPSLESSALVQCSICMLAVHQLCYGIDKLPENKSNWICDRCDEQDRSLINCTLCPCRGGALKAIRGTWMHITCALSVPGFNFLDLIRPDIKTIAKVKLPEDSEKKSCVYCAKNLKLLRFVSGRCVDCVGYFDAEGKQVICENKFHTTCGHRYGGKFDYFDYHIDPSLEQPIRGTCAECVARNKTPGEDNESEKKAVINPIQVGANVIAWSKHEGCYLDGQIVEALSLTRYEVFYPELSEIEVQIEEDCIRKIDDSQELKIGDKVIVNEKRAKPREGKLRDSQICEEYQIKFTRTGKTEKVERRGIYLNIDQLPENQLETYFAENGYARPAKFSLDTD